MEVPAAHSAPERQTSGSALAGMFAPPSPQGASAKTAGPEDGVELQPRITDETDKPLQSAMSPPSSQRSSMDGERAKKTARFAAPERGKSVMAQALSGLISQAGSQKGSTRAALDLFSACYTKNGIRVGALFWRRESGGESNVSLGLRGWEAGRANRGRL